MGGAAYGGGARGGSWGGGGGAGYYRGGYGTYGGYGRGYPYGGYGGYGRGYGYGGIGIGIGLGLPGYGGFGYYGDGLGYPDYPYGDALLYGNSSFPTSPYLTRPLTAGPPAIQQPGGDVPSINGNAPSVAMQSFYSGPSSSPGTAELTVKVPTADASLWLGSLLSGQQGTERNFTFPSLGQGNNVFSLRCTWTENGQTISREKKLNVRAGENATVDFSQAGDDKPQPGNAAPAAPANGAKTNPPPLPPTGLPK
jgi:uncharacterized protein (TIGR03000 family)